MLQVNATILQLVNIKSKWRNPTRSITTSQQYLDKSKRRYLWTKHYFFFNLTENFISNPQKIGVKQIQNSTFQHRNVKKCFVQWLRATQHPIQNTCFLRETRGLPTPMVNFLLFSDLKAENKTDPGIKQ